MSIAVYARIRPTLEKEETCIWELNDSIHTTDGKDTRLQFNKVFGSNSSNNLIFNVVFD